MFTNQSAFDAVVRHLHKQNAWSVVGKASHGRPVCRYRCEDGLMCAIGALMPNGVYHHSMEGKPIRYLIQRSPHLGEFFQGADIYLLSHLQMIHDEHQPYEWPEMLFQCATEYHLNPAVIKECYGEQD